MISLDQVGGLSTLDVIYLKLVERRNADFTTYIYPISKIPGGSDSVKALYESDITKDMGMDSCGNNVYITPLIHATDDDLLAVAKFLIEGP